MDSAYPLSESQQPPQQKRVHWYSYIFVVIVSLLGGVLGIGGAFLGEAGSTGLILGAFLGAPIIEEAFKPIGVFLALVRWPDAFSSHLFTAILCGLAGLVFGILEALVYLYVYVPDHTNRFKIYRLTIPLAVHTIASFTVGLGLDRRIVDVVNKGTPLPRRTRNCYLAGVGIHALFNTTVTIIAVAGLVDFN
ncbi:MAG: PrsW family glutamic-type intramembrane protease [Chloroflexota bacterium]